MPAFVTPSATTRPFRRLREFNDCNLPEGDSDGGRFGANDDPRCAGGAGDADRWGSLRGQHRQPRVSSEDTRTSATKGGAKIEPGFNNVAQIEPGDEYNPRVVPFVLGGRTSEQVVGALLQHVAEEFVVEVQTHGETVDGEELFDPAEARAAWEQEQRRIRPEELQRRMDLTEPVQNMWIRAFPMGFRGINTGITNFDLPKDQLLPADPSRVAGLTPEQALRDSIAAAADVMRASYIGDQDPSRIDIARQSWLKAAQAFVDMGITTDLTATFKVPFGADLRGSVWEQVALQEFSRHAADPTVLQSMDEYTAARTRTYEQYVQAVWGDEANAEIGSGAVQFSMEGSDGTEITRTFKRDESGSLTVKHDLFETATGGGMAKDLLRGSFELYEQMGVRTIATVANISTGSYSWARFGFLPATPGEANNLGSVMEQARLDDVAGKIKVALGDYWHDDIEKQIRAPIERLKRGDRTALWDIADLRLKGSVEQMQLVARAFDSSAVMQADFYLKPADKQRWDSTSSRDATNGMFNVGRVLLTGLGYEARFYMNQRPVSEHAIPSAKATHAENAKLLVRQRQRLMDYIGDWTKPR